MTWRSCAATLSLVVAVIASASAARAQGTGDAPGTEAAEVEAKPSGTDPLTGSFTLTPHVVLVINSLYGSRLLLPGSFGLFAVPPELEGDQFLISASNTTFGFSVAGVSYRRYAIVGALEVTLKTPTPLISVSVLSPQFYSAYVGAEGEHVIVRAGQYPDVVMPFLVRTTNGFPGSFLPGQIGFARPQLRIDGRLPFGEHVQALLQGSLGRPVQTFQASQDVLGAGAGRPDGQARVAFSAGSAADDDPWKRKLELGLSGHLGRRRVITGEAEMRETRELTSWSAGADLRAELPSGTALYLRLWRGAALGDYTGGGFQLLSVEKLVSVGARGFLVAASQDLPGSWQLNAGFGRDDPDDADLGTGERTLNEAGFANVFWNWSKLIGFAVEASRWRTAYADVGETRAWRGEAMLVVRR
jgi:hypothetical protein